LRSPAVAHSSWVTPLAFLNSARLLPAEVEEEVRLVQVKDRIIGGEAQGLVVKTECRREVFHFPGDDGQVDVGEDIVGTFGGQKFEHPGRAFQVFPVEEPDAVNEQGIEIAGLDAPVERIGFECFFKIDERLVRSLQLEIGQAKKTQGRGEPRVFFQHPLEARDRLSIHTQRGVGAAQEKKPRRGIGLALEIKLEGVDSPVVFLERVITAPEVEEDFRKFFGL
jgi:hypothetical protein